MWKVDIISDVIFVLLSEEKFSKLYIILYFIKMGAQKNLFRITKNLAGARLHEQFLYSTFVV